MKKKRLNLLPENSERFIINYACSWLYCDLFAPVKTQDIFHTTNYSIDQDFIEIMSERVP